MKIKGFDVCNYCVLFVFTIGLFCIFDKLGLLIDYIQFVCLDRELHYLASLAFFKMLCVYLTLRNVMIKCKYTNYGGITDERT